MSPLSLQPVRVALSTLLLVLPLVHGAGAHLLRANAADHSELSKPIHAVGVGDSGDACALCVARRADDRHATATHVLARPLERVRATRFDERPSRAHGRHDRPESPRAPPHRTA